MITENKVVTLTYNLYVGEQGDELMEQATIEAPLIYCHGRGMMLPKFESNLDGKKADDEFDFVISYSDAYGEYDDEAVLQLDREMFENEDGKLDERVKQFAIVPLNTVDGRTIQAQIIDIDDKKVTVDLNHPLAGENLHFVGKIIDIRDATEQELKALEGGCGCQGGCNCDGGCEGGCC